MKKNIFRFSEKHRFQFENLYKIELCYSCSVQTPWKTNLLHLHSCISLHGKRTLSTKGDDEFIYTTNWFFHACFKNIFPSHFIFIKDFLVFSLPRNWNTTKKVIDRKLRYFIQTNKKIMNIQPKNNEKKLSHFFGAEIKILSIKIRDRFFFCYGFPEMWKFHMKTELWNESFCDTSCCTLYWFEQALK